VTENNGKHLPAGFPLCLQDKPTQVYSLQSNAGQGTKQGGVATESIPMDKWVQELYVAVTLGATTSWL